MFNKVPTTIEGKIPRKCCGRRAASWLSAFFVDRERNDETTHKQLRTGRFFYFFFLLLLFLFLFLLGFVAWIAARLCKVQQHNATPCYVDKWLVGCRGETGPKRIAGSVKESQPGPRQLPRTPRMAASQAAVGSDWGGVCCCSLALGR